MTCNALVKLRKVHVWKCLFSLVLSRFRGAILIQLCLHLNALLTTTDWIILYLH